MMGIFAGMMLLLIGVARAQDAKIDARALYETHCAFCHGLEGKGDGPAGVAVKPPPPDFTSESYWQNVTGDSVKQVIANGKPGSRMAGFGRTLKPEEIQALADYVRSFVSK